MGYTTTFKGRLNFTMPADAAQLAALNELFGQDCRDHPEWNPPKYCGYIDLRLCKDFKGIEWDDETEKASSMVDQLSVVLEQMRKQWPEFSLSGELLAQGEDIDDRYIVAVEGGLAKKVPVAITGRKVECPHCGKTFREATA